MTPEWGHIPVLCSKCALRPLGCLHAHLVRYQGASPFSPHTCCSLLWFPHRSEFTDTILSVHPSDVLDMPVDPNEPTYCLCHQVSYGEMIGCDNPDVSEGAVHGAGAGGHGILTAALSSALQCPIEWFHFACVDLTTKPKGKWSVWALLGLSLPTGRPGCCPHQDRLWPWALRAGVLLPGAELVEGRLHTSPGSGVSRCSHNAPSLLFF